MLTIPPDIWRDFFRQLILVVLTSGKETWEVNEVLNEDANFLWIIYTMCRTLW